MNPSSFYSTQDCEKTLSEMVACARREYNMRKRVYPRWVEGGRMTAEKAQHEIETMECIYYTLFRLKELQETSEDMIAQEEKRQKQNEQTQLKL